MGCEMQFRETWCCKVESVGFSDRFGFEVAVRIRHTPPAPLERGDLECLFFVDNEWFEWRGFPVPERGLRGGTVRGAGWADGLREAIGRDACTLE